MFQLSGFYCKGFYSSSPRPGDDFDQEAASCESFLPYRSWSAPRAGSPEKREPLKLQKRKKAC